MQCISVFSDNNREVVYQFLYYDFFKAELEPLLHEVRCSVYRS
jgi:type I restriction-modification system DNA methylase subunit